MMKSVSVLLIVCFVSGILAYTSENRKYRRQTERVSSIHRYSLYTREVKNHVFKHSTRSQVIIAPSLPIRFHNINYFWYGNYEFDSSHPLKCEYLIEETDKEFDNVTYSDGSKPLSLQFGCLDYQTCCGLECCGDRRSSIVTICFVFCIVLAVSRIFDKYRKCSRQRKEAASSRIITVDNPLYDQSMEIHAV